MVLAGKSTVFEMCTCSVLCTQWKLYLLVCCHLAFSSYQLQFKWFAKVKSVTTGIRTHTVKGLYHTHPFPFNQIEIVGCLVHTGPDYLICSLTLIRFIFIWRVYNGWVRFRQDDVTSLIYHIKPCEYYHHMKPPFEHKWQL